MLLFGSVRLQVASEGNLTATGNSTGNASQVPVAESLLVAKSENLTVVGAPLSEVKNVTENKTQETQVLTAVPTVSVENRTAGAEKPVSIDAPVANSTADSPVPTGNNLTAAPVSTSAPVEPAAPVTAAAPKKPEPAGPPSDDTPEPDHTPAVSLPRPLPVQKLNISRPKMPPRVDINKVIGKAKSLMRDAEEENFSEDEDEEEDEEADDDEEEADDAEETDDDEAEEDDLEDEVEDEEDAEETEDGEEDSEETRLLNKILQNMNGNKKGEKGKDGRRRGERKGHREEKRGARPGKGGKERRREEGHFAGKERQIPVPKEVSVASVVPKTEAPKAGNQTVQESDPAVIHPENQAPEVAVSEPESQPPDTNTPEPETAAPEPETQTQEPQVGAEQARRLKRESEMIAEFADRSPTVFNDILTSKTIPRERKLNGQNNGRKVGWHKKVNPIAAANRNQNANANTPQKATFDKLPQRNSETVITSDVKAAASYLSEEQVGELEERRLINRPRGIVPELKPLSIQEIEAQTGNKRRLDETNATVNLTANQTKTDLLAATEAAHTPVQTELISNATARNFTVPEAATVDSSPATPAPKKKKTKRKVRYPPEILVPKFIPLLTAEEKASISLAEKLKREYFQTRENMLITELVLVRKQYYLWKLGLDRVKNLITKEQNRVNSLQAAEAKANSSAAVPTTQETAAEAKPIAVPTDDKLAPVPKAAQETVENSAPTVSQSPAENQTAETVIISPPPAAVENPTPAAYKDTADANAPPSATAQNTTQIDTILPANVTKTEQNETVVDNSTNSTEGNDIEYLDITEDELNDGNSTEPVEVTARLLAKIVRAVSPSERPKVMTVIRKLGQNLVAAKSTEGERALGSTPATSTAKPSRQELIKRIKAKGYCMTPDKKLLAWPTQQNFKKLDDKYYPKAGKQETDLIEPQAPKAPKAPQVPQAAQAPKSAQVPKAPEVPKAAQAPKAPQAPKATIQAPKTAQPAKAPEVSKPINKSPQQPKESTTKSIKPTIISPDPRGNKIAVSPSKPQKPNTKIDTTKTTISKPVDEKLPVTKLTSSSPKVGSTARRLQLKILNNTLKLYRKLERHRGPVRAHRHRPQQLPPTANPPADSVAQNQATILVTPALSGEAINAR